MKRSLLCPRTELCIAYRTYVDSTKDDNLGVIKVSTIDNRDFYSCTALSTSLTLVKDGKVPEEIARRFQDSPGCFLIDQANKNAIKGRHDS